MIWSDVIADPTLQDLPYRIELNRFGQIVMQPLSNRHGMTLSEMVHAMNRHSCDGQILIACSIATREGVKVPDAAWMSDRTWSSQSEKTPFDQAPELCVEVISPSDSRTETEEKIQLYFERGAHEVWLCSEDGRLDFFAPQGSLDTSSLFPDFPSTIK